MTPRTKALTVADLRMEHVTRLAAGAALFVVAASFTFSFAQITWVSQYALSPEAWWLNLLLPLIIDAPALIASALTVALHNRHGRLRVYAWTVLLIFTAASWVCNGVHAVVHSALPPAAGGAPWAYALVVLIAGFPPVGVVLGVHLWAFALRHSPAADQRAPERERTTSRSSRPAERPTPTPERMPSAPTSAPLSAPAPAHRATVPPAPNSVPNPTPATVSAPVSAPKPVPASALRDQARALYDEMLPDTAAGKPVDAAELRRRLEVPEGAKAPSAQTVRRWRAEFETEDQAAAETPAEPERRAVHAV